MKLILDGNVCTELVDYLLNQDGINNVKSEINNQALILLIDFNDKITPEIIMKHINLFLNKDYSVLHEFDKGIIVNSTVLNYTIDDICCEYCYKGLVLDLFENDMVKSVKSNYDFNKSNLKVDFEIEYNDNYNEQDLIDYINKKFNNSR